MPDCLVKRDESKLCFAELLIGFEDGSTAVVHFMIATPHGFIDFYRKSVSAVEYVYPFLLVSRIEEQIILNYIRNSFTGTLGGSKEEILIKLASVAQVPDLEIYLAKVLSPSLSGKVYQIDFEY